MFLATGIACAMSWHARCLLPYDALERLREVRPVTGVDRRQRNGTTADVRSADRIRTSLPARSPRVELVLARYPVSRIPSMGSALDWIVRTSRYRDHPVDFRRRSMPKQGMAADRRSRDEPMNSEVDVVVVGAGFAGLYALHRLRRAGFSAVVLERADDVGGTWYWNRYPGARCDIESLDYSYSFDPELEKEWRWSERYATQPEILRYLGHVADRYDLRRDIRFETRIESATWDGAARRWRIRTDRGDEIRCRFYVMATGCLSMPKEPELAGADR